MALTLQSTACLMCGADLTRQNSVSIDFPDVEWCYFTIHLDPDAHPVLPLSVRRTLPDDNLTHLSCAHCGDWLQEI